MPSVSFLIGVVQDKYILICILLSYCRVSISVWMYLLDSKKMFGKKKLDGNYKNMLHAVEQTLQAIPLTHLTTHTSKTNKIC